MDTQTANQPRLSDYLRPLWSRKWLILVAVVVATAGVFAYYAQQAKVYTSGTPIYVKDPGDPVSGAPTPQSTDRNVSNLASLLYSRDVAASVARRISYDGTSEELLERVSITSKVGEDFVEVTSRGRSPREAAAIANAYAREFVTLVNDSQSTRVTRALDLTRKQLEQLPRGPATSAARLTLGEQIRRLELAETVPQTTARQIDPAVAPTAPTSPKPARNALFAFVLSLMAAVAVAFGLERFDRRLRRPEEIEGVYGVPLLAVVPHSGKPVATDGAATLGADFREPFRVLRTNIELQRIDAPARTIVVSSAMPGEGKSTVVRNLALAFSETGKRVAVVEGDLRHPTLAAQFGVQVGRGLTDVLRREADLEDVLLGVGAAVPTFDDLVSRAPARDRTTERPARANGNGHHDEPRGSVSLLLAGQRPANPPAVLASERVIEVLDALRDTHDVVIIDSAPLLAVIDTVPLLRYADGTVFVGRLGVTTRDTAKRLVEFLARVPDANVLGVVANDLSRLDATGYGYGYGYGDEPAEDITVAAPPAKVKQPA